MSATSSSTPAKTAPAGARTRRRSTATWRRVSGSPISCTSDASTILRTGFGITYFPSPYAAGNLNHLNVPFVISQNVNHETNPLDFSRVRTIADPFPPIVPVKPTTTAELIAANPRVSGHSYENETA